ncbi:uncharacterized protein LOC143514377 isoform X2 [Brachyhypopomus gauderio]|uniref:uncharacterized protein LOC143514377 isoform X2 n=1 Tax=Brachyhypopomus gauderio TaxID=698409 RepID=UPI004041B9CA
MAKGSTFTRGLCIVLNILLGIFGVVLLLFGVANSVKVVEDGFVSVILSVGFGLATVLLSMLGVYGAYREQVLALLVYSVLMAIECIVLIVLAIIVTLTQTQKEAIERDLDKMIPLSQANASSKQRMEKVQLENRCCGLKDFLDWREQVPPSCLCPPDDQTRQLMCIHTNRTTQNNHLHTGPTTSPHTDLYVYEKTCGPIIIKQRMNTLKILLGIFFTLATITAAAVIVALLLCYKIHAQSAITGISKDSDSRRKYELRPDEMP